MFFGKTFKIQTIEFCLFSPKTYAHFTMQNAFILSPRVLRVLTVPVLLKSENPKSPLRLKANS
jgi:hypothetical protein